MRGAWGYLHHTATARRNMGSSGFLFTVFGVAVSILLAHHATLQVS